MQDIDRLIQDSLKGEKLATSRLISLVERGDEHAAYILEKIYPHCGSAYYIGITGPPGSGKSTMVDKLVKRFCGQGISVGVVAVDPCSPFTGGALLGDRVRLNIKKKEYDYFFRSMSAGKAMGGLSRTTKETSRILDASGRQIIIIETVGVGQSEIDIAKATDTVVVMITPESGDTMQTMKAGLLEIADIFVINKADRPGVENMAHALNNMLDRIQYRLEWRPPLFLTSASLNRNIDALYDGIWSHHSYLMEDSNLEKRRKVQMKEELRQRLEYEFSQVLWRYMNYLGDIDRLVDRVCNEKVDPQNAARRLVEDWLHKEAAFSHQEG